MLHIPHVEQCQAHTDCADDAGVVGGPLANLHEVISRDKGKGAEAQKRRQRGNRENVAPTERPRRGSTAGDTDLTPCHSWDTTHSTQQGSASIITLTLRRESETQGGK